MLKGSMPTITLEQAQAKFTAASAAYDAALEARAVGFADRSVTYQQISDLRAEMEYWQRVVYRLENPSSQPGIAIATWTR